MKRDFEYQLLKVRESMMEELELKYKKDIKTQDELIELLKAKVSEGSPTLRSNEHTVSIINGRNHAAQEASQTSQRLRIP